MTIYTVIADEPGGRYSRLANVFTRSIRANMPDIDVRTVPRPRPKKAAAPYKPNVYGFLTKLETWSQIVHEAREPVILADCDMLMVNPIEQWPTKHEIAFTERNTPTAKVNTGIVFVQPNHRTRQFFRVWLSVYQEMLEDFDFYMEYAPVWAGGDQAALGYIFEEQIAGSAQIDRLGCARWNLTQSEWDDFTPGRSQFVHIKSDLRKLCLGEVARMRAPATERMREIAALWRVYDEA